MKSKRSNEASYILKGLKDKFHKTSIEKKIGKEET